MPPIKTAPPNDSVVTLPCRNVFLNSDYITS